MRTKEEKQELLKDAQKWWLGHDFIAQYEYIWCYYGREVGIEDMNDIRIVTMFLRELYFDMKTEHKYNL